MSKKITDLQPQKKNMNKHTEHGERLLRKTVQQYGIADGITVAANDEAISGSLRIETLADMMPDVKIQIVETYGDTLLVNKRMDIPTPDTKTGRALSVASNQVANTDYNPDGELLKEWGDEDKDIKAMFAESEWEEITGEEKPVRDAEPQIDRAAELLEKWKVKTGDLWQIGDHRLICGDCTDPAVVARVMGGERADLGIHDAPYNVNMQRSGSIEGDNQTPDEFRVFCSEWIDNFYGVSDNASIFVCIGFREYPLIAELCRPLWDEKNCIVWSKPTIGMGGLNGGYRYQHELIWFGGKGISDKSLCDVWEFDRDANYMHPTLKPLPLIEKMIADTNGEMVADFFSGSGTTLVACQNLNRRGRAIEISPAYCAVTLERMATAFPELEIKRLE